jgi:DNA mismatch endonuclease (patch repair protein)
MPTPYPHPTSSAVTAVMRANRKTDTGPEKALRSELHRMGYRFRKHVAIAGTDRTARADICFSRQRVAVFVDGCFWHGCPEHGTVPRQNVGYWTPKLAANKARDCAVDIALAGAGWRVLRVWEHESVPDAANRIASVLALRASRSTAPSPSAATR